MFERSGRLNAQNRCLANVIRKTFTQYFTFPFFTVILVFEINFNIYLRFHGGFKSIGI